MFLDGTSSSSTSSDSTASSVKSVLRQRTFSTKLSPADTKSVPAILVTNVDFDAWAEYLGDAPLAMAMLDRLVDGSIIIKLKGPSYRASRSANMNQ